MLFRPLSDHWNHMAHTQLGQLFQRPLKAIKFKNGKINSNLRESSAFNSCAQLKLNLIVRGKDYFRRTEHAVRCNIEFLAYFYAENTKEMVGVGSQQKGAVTFHAVRYPASACHTRLSIT